MNKIKSFDFEIKDVRIEEDKKLGFISGLASTFGNEDREGDVIKKGAFKKSLGRMKRQKRVVPILLSHDFSKQLGGVPAAQLKETDEGLLLTNGMLDLNLERSRDQLSLAKNGFLNTFSFGFLIPEGGVEHSKHGLDIKEIDLLEISLTPVPANPEATMTEVKAVAPTKNYAVAPDDTAWSGSKAREDIKRLTGSEDSPSSSFKNAFFWYDASNADNFTAYKMPFVADVGGSLKIIPKGVFAAAAAVQGARGGLNIPASDMSAVKAKIEKCYSKMDKPSPFDDSKSSNDKAVKYKKELLKRLEASVTICRMINPNI